MKILVVSDFHKIFEENKLIFFKPYTSLIGILSVVIAREKPDNLRCLGDYDVPWLLEDILKLEIDKKVLIGNHDYVLCNIKQMISGGNKLAMAITNSMPQSQRDYLKLLRAWHNSTKAKKYVLGYNQEDRGLEEIDELGGLRVVYCHASLCGEDELYQPAKLCKRLVIEEGENRLSKKDKNDRINITKENFIEMGRLGYDIFFRGHDHIPIIYFKSRENSDSLVRWVKSKKIINLDMSKRYIITLDWFYRDGFANYAILDTEKNTFQMKSLKI